MEFEEKGFSSQEPQWIGKLDLHLIVKLSFVHWHHGTGKVLTLPVCLYFEPSLLCHNGNFCSY